MNALKPYLDVFKKYWISITCGLVAALAVGARFYPIDGWFVGPKGSLSQKLGVSLGAIGQIDGIMAAQHHLPLVSPDQTDAGLLTGFPSPDVTDQVHKVVDQVHDETTKMLQAAVAANQQGHQLLVPGVLPHPDEQAKYNFADTYAKETLNLAHWRKILNAGARPTDDEVAAATAALKQQIFQKYGVADGDTSSGAYTTAVDEFNNISNTLKPDMETDTAKKFAMYLEPDAITYDHNIMVGAGRPSPGPAQIWSAQLGIWILDDITGAIRGVNDADAALSGSNDILHNPVKDLQLVEGITPVLSSNAADLQAGVGTPTPKVLTVSPSGRVSNLFYDVYSFKLTLVVEAAKIPFILRQIEAGRFLTVQNVQIDDVVDPAEAYVAGYRYGDKLLAKIEVDGEDILLKNWTADLMPDEVKNGPTALPTGGAPASGVRPGRESNNGDEQ